MNPITSKPHTVCLLECPLLPSLTRIFSALNLFLVFYLFCYILSTHRDGSFSVLRVLVHVRVLPLPRDHIPSRDLLPIPPFLQTQPSSLAEPSWPTPSSSPNFCGTRVWGLHVLPSNIHPACPCVPRLCA